MITHLAMTLALLNPAPSPSPAPTEKMEISEVSVPVDWDRPEGRAITLKVGRLPATGKAEGSVLIAYGGPGAPGILLTETMPQMWAELRKG
ncbi:hypothetical protein ACFQGX_29020 [Nonomuraea dietziae]|uniref:hypothetical protein n=1 Tax=Nonomuraea dietziae TaxID=65515 RepID=UPI00360ED21D